MKTAREILEAWDAAAQVTATAYAVEVSAIQAPTSGKAGPRPPKMLWEAKKMAVHLAVVLADCDYAALGRIAGLHRDTVASHCAWLRKACDEDGQLEALTYSLETSAKLRLASGRLTPLEQAASEPLDNLLKAMREYATAIAPDREHLFHPTVHPTISVSSDKSAKSRKRDNLGRNK